ncbi:UNKNOWN [Stylonychia lemnae]|uniref:Uncharacterized protein n=1 Tax=Stylonychia lemnae TaxID=5949 RepID=A0A078AXD1_STYLE|nr:UNKNOWN [Stylonychia lemnae]|eukprot:CDW85438.1 UNKNOWN [Stylonychia lemnae]
MIFGVVIQVFQLGHQLQNPLYRPNQIQIEIGYEFGNYHYKSNIFEVSKSSNQEQVFNLLPDLVSGEYIRISLYGKPNVMWSKQRYIVLRYVGIQGLLHENITSKEILNMVALNDLELNALVKKVQ